MVHKMRVRFPASTPSRVGLLKPVVLSKGRFRRPLEEQTPGMLLNTLQRTGRPYERVIRSQMSLGHRFATMGGGSGAGFEAIPAGGAAPPRDASLSQLGGANPRPLGWTGTRAGAFLRAPW